MAIWTLIVAALAVSASVFGAYLTRKTGREVSTATAALANAAHVSAQAATRASEASEISSQASVRGAKAAEDAVEVSRGTAAQLADREKLSAFASRYQDAASLLGGASPAVRLAGLQSLARLADDWPDQRSSCISLLCSYLRIGDNDEPAEQQVRSAAVLLLSDHLVPESPGGPPTWQTEPIDLRGAQLAGVAFRNITCVPTLDMQHVQFTGKCLFDNALLQGGARLDGATVRSDASLSFENVRGGRVIANRMTIEPGATVTLNPAELIEFQAEALIVEGTMSIFVQELQPDLGFKFSRLTINSPGMLQIHADTDLSVQAWSARRRVIISVTDAGSRSRIVVDPDLIEQGVVQFLTLEG